MLVQENPQYTPSKMSLQDPSRIRNFLLNYTRLDEEPWSEAQQERLELLRARVVELNRQLGALAEGWRRGPLSLHMNLALPTASLTPNPAGPNASVLRSQNRLLAEEVNKKNERISILEREKSALIRELLLQRNRSKIIDNFA